MDGLRDFAHRQGARVLAVVSLVGILTGGILALSGDASAGNRVWGATIVVMLVPLTWSVARALLRGDVGVDVIALMAMVAALLTGEELAGAIVALMLSGGNALEDYAAEHPRTVVIPGHDPGYWPSLASVYGE